VAAGAWDAQIAQGPRWFSNSHTRKELKESFFL